MTPKINDGTRRRAVLPVVRLEGTAYFIDLSQRQFRETMNQGDYVDFDSVKGKRLCEEAGVVTCLRCGASVIVAASLLELQLRCVRCGAAVNG